MCCVNTSFFLNIFVAPRLIIKKINAKKKKKNSIVFYAFFRSVIYLFIYFAKFLMDCGNDEKRLLGLLNLPSKLILHIRLRTSVF